MLLHHEAEGAAKPVPPGVKHVIASSNLPAPECAKLQEKAQAHSLANSAGGTPGKGLSPSGVKLTMEDRAFSGHHGL